MNERIDITAYLLGELPPAEHERAERREHEDAEFRAEVERLRPVVARLDSLPTESWDALEPPALEFPGGESGSGAERRTPWWRRGFGGDGLRLRPATVLAATVLIAGAGLAAGLVIGGGDEEPVTPAGPAIALEPLGEDAAPASGSFELGGEGAALRVSGLPPNAESEFYELWLLNAPDDLVSLGSFRVPESGEAEIQVPVPVEPDRFAFVDVSVEDVDGDPGHSGDSVLRGPTT
jgi:anti-sigma-K factor RskA